MSKSTCSTDGCGKPTLARGWCGTHYAKWRRSQLPQSPSRTSAVDRGAVAKTCSACRLTKPVDAFYLSRDRHGEIRWIRSECKDCTKARVRRDVTLRDNRELETSGPQCAAPDCERLTGEPKGKAGRHPKYCSRQCKDRDRERQPMSHEDVVRYHRAKTLRRYGLTEADWDTLLIAQAGRCGICRGETPGGKGRWHIDHCHATGKVRGLLCHHCNVGLGNFKDDPDLLRTAIAYLAGAA